ncbi:MAG: tetratricopeptide repeat protein, partial [Gemmatimonadetes bacterium]|nr:tetratricopeptide repeat protein [Gemmatimonadota bacterium]
VVVVSQRVLALPVAAIPEVHPVRGDAYINLAAVAKDRGDTAQAVRLARSGSRILEQWFGPQHHRTAGGIAEYGRAYIAAQAWDDAERELRRALAIRERVYGTDHPLVANLWSDLANVAIGRQRPAEAEPIFRRIIEMYRRRHDDRHYLIGLFRGNLAGTLLRLNRPVEAEQELRAGLAMYALTLPPDHQNVGIHLVRLARALVAQRRYREAIDAAERGLGVLQKQSVPPKAWVDGARQAQLDSYVALGDSSNARATRASLSAESPARPPR